MKKSKNNTLWLIILLEDESREFGLTSDLVWKYFEEEGTLDFEESQDEYTKKDIEKLLQSHLTS